MDKMITQTAADAIAAVLAHPTIGLRLNPFEPEIPIKGKPTRFRYTSGPLDPRMSDGYLKLFFNLYKWMDKVAIEGLNAEGRLVRLDRLRADHAMLVLISGVSGSGRTSVRNLLLYEIEQRLQHSLLLVEYPVRVVDDPQQNAIDLAMRLQDEVEDIPNLDLAMAIGNTLERWQKGTVGGSPNPDTLFALLKRRLDRNIPERPVVFSLEALSHKVSSDNWRPICTMLGQIASFIIVLLTDTNDARNFRKCLDNGEFQVAWIDAPQISKHVMKEFLELRLSQERVGGAAAAANIAPFTAEALVTTFATSDEKGEQELTIALALARLAGLFDWKLHRLSQMLATAGGSAASLPVETVEISAQDVRDFLKLL